MPCHCHAIIDISFSLLPLLAMLMLRDIAMPLRCHAIISLHDISRHAIITPLFVMMISYAAIIDAARYFISALLLAYMLLMPCPLMHDDIIHFMLTLAIDG
jgi:hypothetical protein